MDTKAMIEAAGLATLSGLILEAEKLMPSEQVKMLVVFATRFGKNHEYYQEAIAEVDTSDWGADDPRDYTV